MSAPSLIWMKWTERWFLLCLVFLTCFFCLPDEIRGVTWVKMMNLCILYCNTLSLDISLWMRCFNLDSRLTAWLSTKMQKYHRFTMVHFRNEHSEAIDDTPPVNHQKVGWFLSAASASRPSAFQASVTGFTGFSRLLKVTWLALEKRAKQKRWDL